MSTQLAALGIDVIEGYEPDQLKLEPDVFVVGNVMSRGNAAGRGAARQRPCPTSPGPEWLARNVLHGRWVLGVAGTHGKTTTTQPARVDPRARGARARIPDRRRAARLRRERAARRRPALRDRGRRVRHGVLRQAREVRALPAAHRDPEQPRARPRRHLSGRRLDPAAVPPAAAHGARQWPAGRATPRSRTSTKCSQHGLLDAGRALRRRRGVADATGASTPMPASRLRALRRSGAASAASGDVDWDMLGRHNAENALAALVAARACGRGRAGRARGAAPLRRRAPPARGARHRATASSSTTTSRITRRRSRPRSTACGARRASGRVIAVLEPRSNTMKLGTHKAALADSLRGADRVFVYQSPEVKWDVADAMQPARRAGDGARRTSSGSWPRSWPRRGPATTWC